ncbi:oligosaccharide flippase family protein [uncultured Clostridium sp.]|uniref:oligosaccharide flippase family protein n=1 Tax=uncultured Clostridium sp. TaxID=59620 RepID=UPI00261438D2|nr:oligosaccharide flippase family protein [uncultured Clostridium sp.]
MLYMNVIFKMLLNICNIIIPIIVGPYIMRVLSNTQVGQLNYVQSIFGYFFIFASFGVMQYGIREISQRKNDKKKIQETLTSLFIVTVITNIVAGLLYLIVSINIIKEVDIRSIAIIFTLYFMFNIFQVEWIVTALENFKFITIKTLIIKVIYVVAIFIFVRTPEDFNKYVFIIISTSCLGNLISYAYIKKYYKFDFSNIKIMNHLKPMFLMVIISNANILYTQLDRYMLGSIVGMTLLSYYAISQGIMSVINTLLMSVIQACIPRLNGYSAGNNKKEYINLLTKVSRVYFMILFPASIGILLLGEELIVLYGGSQYVGAGGVLACFAIYMITLGFDNILGNQIMYINKKEKIQVKFLFVGGIINLFLNLLCIKLKVFTPITAILTTTVANIVVIVLQHIYIKIKLNIEYNIFQFKNIQYLIISMIFIPIVLIIKNIGIGTLSRVIISIGVCCIIYGGILLMKKDEIVLMIINKFMRKKQSVEKVKIEK